jgi:protein SCO1
MKIVLRQRIFIVLFTLILIGLLFTLSGTVWSPEKSYHMKCTIVDLVPERHRIIIAHDDIPGFMKAMTMSYSVKDGEKYEELSPGDEITATLIVNKNSSWLQNIKILQKAHSQKLKGSEK